jgi:hypothetical protein
VLGNRTLQDTIEHRDTAAQEIRDVIDTVAESWGVRVEAILLKDDILGADILANISGKTKLTQPRRHRNGWANQRLLRHKLKSTLPSLCGKPLIF